MLLTGIQNGRNKIVWAGSNSLFISDHETVESSASISYSGEENPLIDDRKYFLNVEDEFLLAFMHETLILSLMPNNLESKPHHGF